METIMGVLILIIAVVVSFGVLIIRREHMSDKCDKIDILLSFFVFIGMWTIVKLYVSEGTIGIIYRMVLIFMLILISGFLHWFAEATKVIPKIIRFARDKNQSMNAIITTALLAGSVFTLLNFLFGIMVLGIK